MIYLSIALGVLASLLLIMLISYRRQLKEICRQLAFLKKHETNMLITKQLSFSELTELSDEMNKFIQQQKKLRIELQTADNQIKETIINLSHDIRTPLTSLDGYFQLLTECEDEVQRERYTRVIQGRIKSLRDLLDELFTYTRLQSDNFFLETEPCCLNKILYESAFSFYNDFKERGIEPEILIPDEQFYASANAPALSRVFQNILKNALIHGGENICINMKAVSKNVVISFSNKLLGSEAIDISRVFERSYRADFSRSLTSTGLGLSISKGLTEKMDGNISAEITDDIFTITLVFPVCHC